ncbi:9672_t:CDS:2, partial [Acaulospora morrowiae]
MGRLSSQYRNKSYPLPPEFGNPSNLETLREILDRTSPQDLQKE